MKTLRKTLPLICVISMLCVGQFVTPAPAATLESPMLDTLGKEVADIAEKTRPAVVRIFSTSVTKQKISDPFDQLEEMFPQMGPQLRRNRGPAQPQERELQHIGLGSGFIVESDGIILTNNHVVAGATELKVVLDNGKEYPAKVKGTDPESEVAVIQIDAKNLPTLELGDSDQLRVGNFAIAIGSPQGLSQTVTFGIISALNRSEVGIVDFANFIQVEASINQGNSGGPLLDTHGRVIGINTAIISTTGGSQGLGLAIPINQARNVYKQLLKDGKVTRGYMGITMQPMTDELAENLGAKDKTGAVVGDVVSPSPAAGVLETYDFITAINGVPVKDSKDVMNRIATMTPGAKVKLTIIRKEKEKEVEVKLGARPTREERLAAKNSNGKTILTPEKDDASDLGLGFQVEALTPEKAKRYGLENGRGVAVTNVDEKSEAYKRGLRPGMVIEQINQQDVKSAKDASDAVKSSGKKSVLLRITDDHGSTLLVLPKGKE